MTLLEEPPINLLPGLGCHNGDCHTQVKPGEPWSHTGTCLPCSDSFPSPSLPTAPVNHFTLTLEFCLVSCPLVSPCLSTASRLRDQEHQSKPSSHSSPFSSKKKTKTLNRTRGFKASAHSSGQVRTRGGSAAKWGCGRECPGSPGSAPPPAAAALPAVGSSKVPLAAEFSQPMVPETL